MAGARRTSLRLGCGSAYAEDLIWPAVELAEKAQLDYIGIDSLAERTLPMASLRRLNDPNKGYDLRLVQLIDELFTVCMKNKVKVVGNMGAANPRSAADLIAKRLRDHGYRGVRIATITGDDVTEWVNRENPLIPTLGKRIKDMDGEIATANAYIGAEPIVEALEGGADIVVGGRLADPSIWLGPMIHEFGWAPDDWEMKGFGQLCAHMLECGLNLTGGNFADPPYRIVEDLVHIGFPFADIYPDKAEAIIKKLPGTGGRLDSLSAKGQLTWEIKDPTQYLTPDVTADLSEVQVEDVADGEVRVWGASGREWPKTLRVLVGVLEGYIAEGEMTYSGLGAVERAQMGAEIIRGRIKAENVPIDELRVDYIGINSAHASVAPEPKGPPHEVRLRVAGRTKDEAAAQWLSHATEYLYIGGPASGGGNRRSVKPVLGSYQTFIPRDQVKLEVHIQEN
jgi:hypothetical protein